VVSAPSTTLDAALVRLPILSGQVTRAGGLALPGVQVQVLNGSTVVAHTETGWLGQYRVFVPAGTYDVKFTRHGYEELVKAAVVVGAPSTTLDAAMTKLPVLTGQVTGAGGLPLPVVKVQVLSGSTVVGSSETGRAGRYSTSVPAGTYDVKFTRHGYEELVKAAVVVTGPSTILGATMTQLPVLTGKVTGAGGVPLSCVKVQVLSGSTVVAHGETGRAGAYSVFVPTGTYDVKFTRSGYEDLLKAAVVVTAPSTTLDAALTQLPVLSGKVTNADGFALRGVKIEVLTGSTVVARAETGWLGQYRVFVPAGTYDVRFTRHGYEVLVKGAVVVAGPSTTLDAILIKLSSATTPV
jgi:hypothetical protein